MMKMFLNFYVMLIDLYWLKRDKYEKKEIFLNLYDVYKYLFW